MNAWHLAAALAAAAEQAYAEAVAAEELAWDAYYECESETPGQCQQELEDVGDAIAATNDANAAVAVVCSP